MTIYGDLVDSLQTAPRLDRDGAAVALAKRYAETLDDLFDQLVHDAATEDPAEHARKVLEITRIGARLEAMLDRLGMAPGARAPVRDGGDGRGATPEGDSLDALRRDAAAGAPGSGVDYTEAVDPAVAEADAMD